jgi:ribosomal protein S18 acetylase RimI-like enzyme
MGDRDDDCYYLVYIGTKPSGQRRGYARKLIEAMAVRVMFFPAEEFRSL